MKRKSILIPMALAACLMLAGCGNSGSASSSSSDGGIIADTSSSSTSTSSSSVIKLSAALTSKVGDTIVSRGVYMGMNDKEYVNPTTSAKSRTSIFVADGTTWYQLYTVSNDYIPANLVIGKSVIEFTGKVSNYTSNDLVTYEVVPSANMTIVTDSSVTAPTLDKLDKDNTTYENNQAHVNHKVAIANAIITEKTVDTSYSNTTIKFKVGTSDTEHTIYLDSRYNDVTGTVLAGLSVGDEFKCNSFSANGKFNYIEGLEEVAQVPASVSIATPTSTTLQATTTLQLSASVLPSGAPQDIVWSSNHEDIATVNATGLVTGVAAGSVTIEAKAKDTSVTSTIDLTIEAAPTLPVTDLSVDFTSATLAKGETKQITATVLPAEGANKTVSYSSDTPTIASVDTTGVITAVGVGNAVITVKTNGKTSSDEQLSKTIAVTVTQYPAGTAISFADLIAKTTGDTSKLYTVSGILEGLDHTDKNGHAYLTDPTSGKSIYVNYLTTTKSVITYTPASGETPASYAYTKPTDSDTALASVSNGQLVTLTVLYNYQYNGGPLVIKGILDSNEDSTSKYTASIVGTPENGSAVLDKSTDLAYGDTVTVTCTPDSKYEVDTVKVETNAGTIDATVDGTDSNKYTFAATCVNKVTVTFVAEPTTPSGVTNYDVETNATSFSNQTTSYGESSSKINYVSVDCGYANYSACSTKSGDWPDTTTKEIIVGANSTTNTTYITLSSRWSFSAASFNLRSWTTKAQNLSFDVEYSTDSGATWTSSKTSFDSSKVTTGANFTVTSGASMVSAKMVRLALSSSQTKAQTSAFLSFDLTYPTV